jgi:hypothetical protein
MPPVRDMWPPLGQRHVGMRRPDADQSFDVHPRHEQASISPLSRESTAEDHLRTVSGSRTEIGFLWEAGGRSPVTPPRPALGVPVGLAQLCQPEPTPAGTPGQVLWFL